jgi:hypothetical protein
LALPLLLPTLCHLLYFEPSALNLTRLVLHLTYSAAFRTRVCFFSSLLPAAVYGVPIAPGRCRAIVRQPFRFKNKLIPLAFKLTPAFMGHLGNNSVLDEDNIFLHMQVR